MAAVTFRDFAGAIMGGNTARAAEVLEELLDLDGEPAVAAATHFQKNMGADPAFMGKAMGLRTAVTTGTDEQISALLVDCFGLGEGTLGPAVASLRKLYPA